MTAKVFLLGRPGSGKSTAFYCIDTLARAKGWCVKRIRDYEILQDMFQADIERKKFSPIEYGGFDVIDFSVLDEASREVERRVRNLVGSAQRKELIFIEFARDDYSIALRTFSPNFLKDAYFLFVETDLETCIQRIHARVAYPTTADDHFVSDTILRSYYCKDNIQYMAADFKGDNDIDKDIVVISNTGSLKDFFEKIYRFIDVLFAQEDEGEDIDESVTTDNVITGELSSAGHVVTSELVPTSA
jgi:hypothetical protein